MATNIKEKDNAVTVLGHLINGEIENLNEPTQDIYNPSNGEVSKKIRLAKKRRHQSIIKNIES